MSFELIKSLLCKTTRLTVEPDIKTGSKIPVGVSIPVLPTFISIFKSLVDFSSGGYLSLVKSELKLFTIHQSLETVQYLSQSNLVALTLLNSSVEY